MKLADDLDTSSKQPQTSLSEVEGCCIPFCQLAGASVGDKCHWMHVIDRIHASARNPLLDLWNWCILDRSAHMKNNSTYRWLELPWLYRVVQHLIASGPDRRFPRKIKEVATELPDARSILDVGCGPDSWLWEVDIHPTGLDLSPSYLATFRQRGGTAVAGSAAAAPFADGSFDGVWSVGLLHHLPDELVLQAVEEMRRVSPDDGYVVILDSVLPEPAWHRPVAWMLRKLDRGRYVRHQRQLESILVDRENWVCERFVYSLWGLEGLLCICRTSQ